MDAFEVSVDGDSSEETKAAYKERLIRGAIAQMRARPEFVVITKDNDDTIGWVGHCAVGHSRRHSILRQVKLMQAAIPMLLKKALESGGTS